VYNQENREEYYEVNHPDNAVLFEDGVTVIHDGNGEVGQMRSRTRH
jgi:predicted kinase